MSTPQKKSYYDPVKAHEYYLRTRELKGRKPKSASLNSGKKTRNVRQSQPQESRQAVTARIGRLKSKISKLNSALSEAQAALVKQRQTAAKTERASSDGKTTAKERQASKEYRDKNKEKIKDTAEKSSSGGSSRSSKSSSTSSSDVSQMSATELADRISRIQGAIRSAKQQLSQASTTLGQLRHSDFMDNELYHSFLELPPNG